MELIEAVIANNYDLVKTFIDEGADVNAYNEDGDNALIIASQIGNK